MFVNSVGCLHLRCSDLCLFTVICLVDCGCVGNLDCCFGYCLLVCVGGFYCLNTWFDFYCLVFGIGSVWFVVRFSCSVGVLFCV